MKKEDIYRLCVLFAIVLGGFFTTFGEYNFTSKVYERTNCPESCILKDCNVYALTDDSDDFHGHPHLRITEGPCTCSYPNPDGSQTTICKNNSYHIKHNAGYACMFVIGIILLIIAAYCVFLKDIFNSSPQFMPLHEEETPPSETPSPLHVEGPQM